MRRREATRVRWHQFTDVGHARNGIHRRSCDRDVTRGAFLEQQFACADHWLFVKARPHHAAIKRVRGGDDQHPLVVGHVHAHHRMRLLCGKPRYRVVEGLVETIVAIRAGVGERFEVPHRQGRLDHRRKSGRVRRNDHIVREAASEAKPGHAKI